LTKRLYYQDAWLKCFEAGVTGHRRDAAGYWLSLTESAFYPEGGGQPWDTGTLSYARGSLKVLEVQADETGEVWHRVDAGSEAELPPPGERLSGEIDFARRFDHMQQHTGEHILANCVWRLTGGFTHGLHIGQDVSSIDVTLPGGEMRLSQETLEEIEALANRRVAGDAEIVCRFPPEEEIEALPLRKDPTVSENVRVCMVGGYEMVACGGTHLSRASQVGLIKILSCQPARGKVRLSFLCGLRAATHYRETYSALYRASVLLSARPAEVPERVGTLLEKAAETERELRGVRREMTLRKVPGLLLQAVPLPDGGRLVVAELEAADTPAMEELAAELIGHGSLVALLSAPGEDRGLFLFARSGDRTEDMPGLMRECGVRGGGQPDFARGAGENGALDRAGAQVLKKNKQA